ncbi:hypothetical protein ACO0KY_17410 [Undibacterium sp. Dicai25W]|uniref:hypothetical protein n=1 Tax=Undibacterium sp. Dicai25W TaxID=3413034 RepID=UPI003BEF5153
MAAYHSRQYSGQIKCLCKSKEGSVTHPYSKKHLNHKLKKESAKKRDRVIRKAKIWGDVPVCQTPKKKMMGDNYYMQQEKNLTVSSGQLK